MSDEGKALITSNISLPFDNFADFPSENVISLACEPYAKEGNTFSLVFGGYPEGVSYSILLMNLAAPLIDRYTAPKKFGYVKPVKVKEVK